MAHVTVPDERPIFEQAVTTEEDTFAFSFTYFDATDIRVTVDYQELSQSEFEVVGNAGTEGGFDGGTVTLDTPAENQNVRIWSDMPPERTSDFFESAGFSSRSVNTQLDRLWARARDARQKFERATVLALPAGGLSLEAADSGTLYSNHGAAAIALPTLPPASAGLVYSFAVTDADGIRVSSNGVETLNDGGTTSETLESTTIGSFLTLRSIGENWFVEEKRGTWA